MSKLAYELILLQAEVKDLRTANELLSKRRRAKKVRLQEGGSLSLQEAEGLRDEIEVSKQRKGEIRQQDGCTTRTETHPRRCSNCSKTGHNARTCQISVEMPEENCSD